MWLASQRHGQRAICTPSSITTPDPFAGSHARTVAEAKGLAFPGSPPWRCNVGCSVLVDSTAQTHPLT